MTGLNIRLGGQQMSLHTLRNMVKKAVSQTIQTIGSAKEKVRKCLRSTKQCNLNIPVIVVGGDLPELADHILDAQMGLVATTCRQVSYLVLSIELQPGLGTTKPSNVAH